MAQYGKLPSNFNTMNESQQNDAVRAAGYTGLSDFRDNAAKISQGGTTTTNAQVSAPANAVATAAPTFDSKSGIVRYTNAAQNTTYGSYVDPNAPGVQSLGDITEGIKSLLPTEAPTAPKMLETYQSLTSDGTVTALEKSIVDLKAEREAELAQLRTNKAAEMDKPVAENIVAGRVNEQTRIAQEKVDFLNRQITTASDELTMRYKSIETIMKYTQQDFENAKSTYDTQFNQAMSIMTQARGIQQDQISAEDKAQDNARANLQIYVNAITSGNLNVNDLPAETRASLNGMELAAGLPMGFVENLSIDSKSQILHINDSTGEVLVSDGNGGFKTIQAMTPTKTGGTGGLTSTQTRNVTSQARKAIQSADSNGDKALSLSEYQEAVQAIMTETGVDFTTADDSATQAFDDLGFVTWHWNK